MKKPETNIHYDYAEGAVTERGQYKVKAEQISTKPTILYNTATSRTVSRVFSAGKKIDRPMSPTSSVVLLEYINTPPPVCNYATQVTSSKWVADLELMQYRLEWSIRDKTPAELNAEQLAIADAEDNTLDPAQVKSALQMVIGDLPEEEQLNYPAIYPAYRVGKAYEAGEKFQHSGQLYKVIQSHTSQLDWLPGEVPALYLKIAPPGTIPDWVQPTGAHDAYAKGAKVRFEGSIYESVIDANVWSPAAYPAGWKKL